MFAGKNDDDIDDIIYIAINTYWEKQTIFLPELPESENWFPIVDTSKKKRNIFKQKRFLKDCSYCMEPRSVAIFLHK